MPASDFTIRFAESVWAQELSPFGDLKYSWGENGPLAASWGMALPVGFLHPALVPGVTVEVFYCGCPVWRGVLTEPNRDTWECTAIGTGENFANLALVGIGGAVGFEYLTLGDMDPYTGGRYATGFNPTGPADLVAEVVRHFDFTVDSEIPTGPDYDVLPIDDALAYADGGVYLDMRSALDAYTKFSGRRWATDEHGLLYLPPEPTTPTLALTPDTPGLGVTLENYYSTTWLRYLDHFETAGGDTVPIYHAVVAHSPDDWRWGVDRERTLEFDPDTQIPEAAAQAIVDALQAEATAAPTQGVTLVDGQLTNMGGTRVPLPLLKTNVMVRHFGVLDVPGARDAHTWVVNHFEMDTVAGTAAVAPRNIAPRTFAQVVQQFVPNTDSRITSDSAAA